MAKSIQYYVPQLTDVDTGEAFYPVDCTPLAGLTRNVHDAIWLMYCTDDEKNKGYIAQMLEVAKDCASARYINPTVALVTESTVVEPMTQTLVTKTLTTETVTP